MTSSATDPGDPVCNVELREFSSKVDLLRGEWQNLAARHIQTLVEIGAANPYCVAENPVT